MLNPKIPPANYINDHIYCQQHERQKSGVSFLANFDYRVLQHSVNISVINSHAPANTAGAGTGQ